MNKIKKNRYYGPLIQYKVELDYLKIVSWINIFLSLFVYMVSYFNDLSGYYKMITKFLLITAIIIFFYSFLIKIINKHKKVSYIVLSINFYILMLNFCFLGLIFFLGANEDLMHQLYSKKSVFYIIIMLISSLISKIIFLWYYLPKNQGKQWSFNQSKSGETKSKKNQYRINFLIMFGVSMIVPAMLTGNIENIFGIIVGLLFSLVIPSLIVDSLYAAYYVHKHPDYE
ncbi:hypothetical protein GKS17_00030 [Streptococcus uberis]|uniref:hypothetical protein n=1 Tax=Streptococcus uberis TaxID=1349 RepID=UPI0012B531AC|nr:hypothetical protein [Streptococcus uberis]MTC89696.1 hypothetical protein [Streptococcus uberis]MTC95200.1 hypothetical protein [Streptococcus uberis]